MKGFPSIVRFVILGISTLCCTIILANMSIYNFTKICPEPYTQDQSYGNYTQMSTQFTKTEKSTLQSASAIGALLAGLPYTYLFTRFPGRYAFVSAGIISTVSTALIPLAYSMGFGWFLAVRIVQGVAFAATYQVIGCVTADWAALGEHGIFLAFLTGSTQLSNIFTLPIAGALCSSSSLGWPSVYYVHAGVCAILFVLYFIFHRDAPAAHPLISAEELHKITDGKKEKKSEKRENVPILAILTDKSILGVWLAAFAELLYVQLVGQYEPIYFNDYLNYDLLSSGFMSAVPIICQFFSKLLCGFTSDMLSCISDTTNVRIYNTIALGLSGIFIIILSFIPRTQQILCVVGITIAVCCTGGVTSGFNKCATLRSRQHAHFVMTQIMNIWAITILIEPFIVDAILTDHESKSQWMTVFIMHGSISIVCNIVFVIVADARPAKWTQTRENAEAIENSFEEGEGIHKEVQYEEHVPHETKDSAWSSL